MQSRGTQGPYLLKVDPQRAEVEILQGAEHILQDTDFLILEVSLFEFFKGAPQFDDCILFMKERGFVVYDIFDMQYRLLDGAMSQVDMAFVRARGSLRKYHFYATKEQRNAQTNHMKSITRIETHL